MAPTNRDRIWAAVLRVGQAGGAFTREGVEAAVEVEVPERSTLRVLTDLADAGYVERHGDHGRHGRTVWTLADEFQTAHALDPAAYKGMALAPTGEAGVARGSHWREGQLYVNLYDPGTYAQYDVGPFGAFPADTVTVYEMTPKEYNAHGGTIPDDTPVAAAARRDTERDGTNGRA